jgi:hypothetical protein
MRRFFVILFVLSLVATAGAYYWRTYYPEHTAAAEAPSTEPGRRSITRDNDGSGARSFRESVRLPSDRQDLAVTISILSSIVSALAAVLQTWLTARTIRR